MNLDSDYRYSEWDNSQQVDPFDANDLMNALSDELLEDGDLQRALQRLYRMGDESRLGDRLEGMKQLIERLRQQRQATLNRHNLSSLMDDLPAKLRPGPNWLPICRKGCAHGASFNGEWKRRASSRPA